MEKLIALSVSKYLENVEISKKEAFLKLRETIKNNIDSTFNEEINYGTKRRKKTANCECTLSANSYIVPSRGQDGYHPALKRVAKHGVRLLEALP